MKRLLFAALALAACAQAPAPAPGWRPIAIAAQPVSISEEADANPRFGPLTFRGGLQLSSKNPLFGGWSGLDFDSQGELIAVSDQGSFLRFKIDLDQSGNLVGVSSGEIALMRDLKGAPLDGKKQQDAEDIARLEDGRYAVSFESRHRIWLYDLDRDGPDAPAIEGPPAPQDMRENEGLEALAQAENGDLVAGREYAANHKSPTQFFRLKLSGGSIVAGPARVVEKFALVALRRLPDGDYLALERYYFPLIGNRSVLARFKASGLADAPPHLDGPTLAEFAKPLALDNFEGLAVEAEPGAALRLYIISDDNFSPSQRTLLYAFDLDEAAASPAPEAPKTASAPKRP